MKPFKNVKVNDQEITKYIRNRERCKTEGSRTHEELGLIKQEIELIVTIAHSEYLSLGIDGLIRYMQFYETRDQYLKKNDYTIVTEEPSPYQRPDREIKEIDDMLKDINMELLKRIMLMPLYIITDNTNKLISYILTKLINGNRDT